MRWQEELSKFRYKWKYRPGRINVADPLSRVQLAALTRRMTQHKAAVPAVPVDSPAANPEPNLHDPSPIIHEPEPAAQDNLSDFHT